jgi:serine O-acetyltransferase
MAQENANGRLDAAVESMLAAYARQPETYRVGGPVAPSREEAIEILHLCFGVLFPGYFGETGLSAENIRYHVGQVLAVLRRRLEEEVFRCLCYHHSGESPAHSSRSPAGCRQESGTKVEAFIGQLPELRDMLVLDVEAYDGDPAAKSFDEIIFCYPGFRAVMVYRIAHALHELGVPLMPRIMTEHAHSITGVDLHPGAHIGKRFFIDHGTGVVVGETTVIGENVKLYQGVTLGALSIPKDERGRAIRGHKRHPTLADNVTVYANATILGGETVIGSGVTVGGNTFITSSVTADSLVSAAPQTQTRPKRKKKP